LSAVVFLKLDLEVVGAKRKKREKREREADPLLSLLPQHIHQDATVFLNAADYMLITWQMVH